MGLTVAERLAEDPAVSLTVVEAGGFHEIESGNISPIPAFAAKAISSSLPDQLPLVDWGLVTVPQPVSHPV